MAITVRHNAIRQSKVLKFAFSKGLGNINWRVCSFGLNEMHHLRYPVNPYSDKFISISSLWKVYYEVSGK